MIKNIQFGLLSPEVNADEVLSQMRLANIYRNRLVDVELQRRAQVDEALTAVSPELRAINAEIEEKDKIINDIYDAQRKRNAKARRNIERSEEDNTQLREAKTRRRELYAARSELRNKLFRAPAVKPRLVNIDKEAANLVKRERAHCGLYWGTYLLVEEAADKFRKGTPPRHKPFRGEGRVGVQIQKGMFWSDVLAATDTRLRVEPVPPQPQRCNKKGLPIPMAGAKRQQKQRKLYMRIGSAGSSGRDPVFAKWHMFLHSAKVNGNVIDRIPPDARVKVAFINRKIVAGRERWCVTFTIDMSANYQPVASSGACGIDVGYRLMPDAGMRVAVMVGDDGHTEDLRIDSAHLDQFDKVEELQSIRDTNFNEIRGVLRDFMDAAVVPEWLTEECATMHAWRRISRLVMLLRRWKEKRFAMDEAIFDRMTAWCDQEYHLWQWQENLRDQLIAWRKDLYRNFARRVAMRYRTVAVEKLDLRQLQETDIRPEDREVPTAMRVSARRADLSSLFQFLKEAAANLKKMPAAYTTTTCHACGKQCDWNKALLVNHTCEHCGVVWDQDHNAAKNLLASGLAPVPEAEKKKSRSQRFRDAKRKKDEDKKSGEGEEPQAAA